MFRAGLSVCLCTGRFVMVPLNLTCLHSLQLIFLEHIFNLYCNIHAFPSNFMVNLSPDN